MLRPKFDPRPLSANTAPSRSRLASLGLLLVLAPVAAWGQDSLAARAQQYLAELVRLDTTNPPGNETRAAEYLKRVLDAEGIPAEILGGDPARMNLVARLHGSGTGRPLLLMAHSDVVPADAAQWSVPPFSAEIREGFLYGRGAQDDKCLLAAELAVLVEMKRRATPLQRDIILLSEADEEAGSAGIQWLVANAWSKIDADFALNEGGFVMDVPSGKRVYQVQTTEKIPTRVVLRAHGTAGHGSLPRLDNPVVALSRAVVRLADADQPVRLNSTTRRYLAAMSKLEDFRWLAPLLPRLQQEPTAVGAARQIRERDPELAAQLSTTVSPTMLGAGTKINVIPNVAEAQVDVRRLPNETREEVIARLRRLIHDNAVEVLPAPGQDMPATEPSSLTTELYRNMEAVFQQASPNSLVVPYMQRGATDGSYLRQKGMAVYGVPVFLREDRGSRAHGNNERISVQALAAGTDLLWKIVLRTASSRGE
ncbi:MAG TPA: M20/M25/M40 family metallo-hydrolase [Bryobacteraceae bacterium]|nr:M20/M25/M40 family metallo-hydrolase [Bryobacteraceae bacterium]